MAEDFLDYKHNSLIGEINPVLSAQFVHTVIHPRIGTDLSFQEISELFDQWRAMNRLPFASSGKIGYWLGHELGKAGFRTAKRPNQTYLNVSVDPVARWPMLHDMTLPVDVLAPDVSLDGIVPAPIDLPEPEPKVIPDLDIDAFIKEHISENPRGRVYRNDVVKSYRFWLAQKTGQCILVSSSGPQMKRFDFMTQGQEFQYRTKGRTIIEGLILSPPKGVQGLRRTSAAPINTATPGVIQPAPELVDEFVTACVTVTKVFEDMTYPDTVLEQLGMWLSIKFDQEVTLDYSDRIYQMVAMRLKREGQWGFRHGVRVYRGIQLLPPKEQLDNPDQHDEQDNENQNVENGVAR